MKEASMAAIYACANQPHNTMRCPKCPSRDNEVIGCRQSRDGSDIRRYRLQLRHDGEGQVIPVAP
jgi:hypothetical protein